MSNAEEQVTQSILCIPVQCESIDALKILIVGKTNGEYLVAGNILMNSQTKNFFEIQFDEHDEQMQQAFTYAGKVTGISDSCLDQIADHNYVVYLISNDIGLEGARALADAGLAILKTAGLGVKVESAGKAFDRESWEQLVNDDEYDRLFDLFVIYSLTNEDGSVYSCGMHNLGYKDTIVYGEEFQDAASLIRIFCYYQLLEDPEIMPGQTFSPEVGAPVFVIEEESDPPYKDHDLFTNPFGMWKMERVGTDN
ncbi:DUF4261 domain-containing protein [Terrimonas sp. NA20]|uniref:DUF4261 domain-containing protein n=1 Tax=Terrimonas ginsenosidimutans TaxID=2908004 RepID=A0ABS9KKK0_9BACT|nr:DUF4261 domain-containing protein [Terrimonas ginsenosidimutans]MCG2612845.1 DUF4261 domain-containing protein [Terrimonas ginsenosidimutans]